MRKPSPNAFGLIKDKGNASHLTASRSPICHMCSMTPVYPARSGMGLSLRAWSYFSPQAAD